MSKKKVSKVEIERCRNGWIVRVDGNFEYEVYEEKEKLLKRLRDMVWQR